MKSEEIQTIKIRGMKNELANVLRSKMWDIKRLAEDACWDNFVNFIIDIQKIHDLTLDAKDLFDEMSDN